MGKWRAICLILVHAAIGAHIVQWLVSGLQTGERRTVSPVEPSEAMYTLELGQLNAGFVFFAAAIASTLVFGRWFCGWGCHVVALQDLCAWMMKKCGVHPKPWRSRLLLWVPLLLALYMFVWPSFRKLVVQPLVGSAAGGVPAWFETWFGVTPPLPGIVNEFIVGDFWKTFAPWFVAIPFLLVCGFAAVYFLGSKGFCNYGCPYGGFFGPVDRLSPMRIRVTDDCNHCGHCTAVCTSNVRVADEVRDYGMVVDPGCFKCLDCRSVCPNGALYVGFGMPAVLAKPRTTPEDRAPRVAAKAARYDLSLGEEIAALVVFLVLFRGFRGMPFLGEQIPLLMAVGLGGIGAFLAHKSWRMLRDLNVRGPRVQLKFAGRVRPAGIAWLLATAAFVFLGVQGAAVWLVTTAGDGQSVALDRYAAANRAAGLSADRVYASGYTPDPEAAAIARRGIGWLELAKPIWEGGVGLYRPLDAQLRLAWFHGVAGDLPGAEAAVRRAIDQRATDEIVLGLARLITLAGGPEGEAARAEEIEQLFRTSLQREPNLHLTRFELARLLAGRGKAADAARVYEEAIERDPGNVAIVRDAAVVHMNLQNAGAAAEALRAGLRARPRSAAMRSDLASVLLAMGRVDEARRQAREAMNMRPDDPEVVGRLAETLVALDQTADAVAAAEHALDKHPRNIGAVRNAAGLNAMAGKPERALEILGAAIARMPGQHILRLERAGVLLQAARRDEAVLDLRAVIAADPADPGLWAAVADLCEAAGLPQEAAAARGRVESHGPSGR